MTNPAVTIWGRANSVNVQKVLWCAHELDITYDRIDAGMEFGRTDQPDYLAINPTGRIPTLVIGDFVLWESNAIMRYFAMVYGGSSSLYPARPRLRAGIERWLDWTLSTLQPAERPVFWGLVRTPPAQRDMPAIQAATDAVARLWAMIDAQLRRGDFIEGEDFSLADLALCTYARRWFGVEGVARPELPNLSRWYAALSSRPGFTTCVAQPLS